MRPTTINMKPWPRVDPDDAMIAPPDPTLKMREISDVELAFPVSVSPSWREAPLKYWNEKGQENRDKVHVNDNDPWIRLASAFFFGRVDHQKIRMAGRNGVDTKKAYRWLTATLKSYEYSQEHKEVVAGWILESFFWAYWFEGEEPKWILDALAEPDEPHSSIQ